MAGLRRLKTDWMFSLLTLITSENVKLSKNCFCLLKYQVRLCKDVPQRNFSIKMNGNTYGTVLSHYAEKGDWKKIQKIFNEVREKKIELTDNEILRVSEKLAIHGYKQFLPQVLVHIPRSSTLGQDILNSILKLINEKQTGTAYSLLLTTITTSSTPTEISNGLKFFIQQLVYANQDLEKIIYFCNKIEEGLKMSPLLYAVEAAILKNNEELFLGLLYTLKNKNFPVRSHYFWPFLIHHRNSRNKEGILKILATIHELCNKADTDTFVDYVFPAFESSTIEDIVMDIKNLGYSLDDIVNPLIKYLINQQDFKKALDINNNFKINLDMPLLISALSRQCFTTADEINCVEVLNSFLVNQEDVKESTQIDYTGQFFLDSLFQNDWNTSKLMSLLRALINQKVSISHSALNFLQKYFKNPDATGLSKLSKQLILNNKQLPIIYTDEDLSQFSQMSLKKLEDKLITLKKKNRNCQQILQYLFIEYCLQKNVGRVLEIKKELDADGFNYSFDMFLKLMDTLINGKHFEKALKVYKEFETRFPYFYLDGGMAIKLAFYLTDNNKFDEAIQLLKSHGERSNVRNYDSVERVIFPYLVSLGENSMEKAHQLVNVLFKYHFLKSRRIFSEALVKIYLLKNDILNAVAEFEKSIKEYKEVFGKFEILSKLIELEDIDNLEKVTQLIISIDGASPTLHYLVQVFIQTGHVEKAKKIFEIPELKINMDKLLIYCNIWLKFSKIDCIENLIDITKNIPDVDHNSMFLLYLKGCRKLKEPQKALTIWSSLQKEGFQFTYEVLKYLADILQEHQITIPFSLPQMELSKLPDEELYLLLNQNKLKEACDFAQNMIAENLMLNTSIASLLVDALLDNGQISDAVNLTEKLFQCHLHLYIPTLKILANKLTLNGDSRMLCQLQQNFPKKVLSRINISTYIDGAFINNNQEESVLERWESDSTTHKIQLKTMNSLLIKQPQTVFRVLKIVEKMVSSNVNCDKHILWQYFIIKEEFDKAKNLIKKFPEICQKSPILVCITAEHSNNELLLTNLIEIIQPFKNSRILANCYSYLIHVQCSNKHYDQALETLDKLKNGSLNIEDLHYSCLIVLKKGLEEKGCAVPFKLPKQKKNLQIEDEAIGE